MVMRLVAVVLPLALSLCGVARAQGTRELPTGWKMRPITGGGSSCVQVGPIATGWRVTTDDDCLWWNPAMVQEKSFKVVLEAVLLPDAANKGFGVFLGGRDLEGDRFEYLSFQIKGDGTYLVELRRGGEVHALAPWMPHRGVPRAF